MDDGRVDACGEAEEEAAAPARPAAPAQAAAAPAGAPESGAAPDEEARLERCRARLAADPRALRDAVTLARMTEIWCADHHDAALRAPYDGAAARLGAFPPGKLPRLCPECAAHARYGEYRRAVCPKDPKPSCRACDVHCYSAEESEWQRRAMAYAGPRAVFRGLARDALRHLRQEVFVARTQDAAKRERRDRGRGQDY